MEFKDYYKVLGVDPKADQKTISQAFRRLARESHPDVNKKKGAEERFKEINEAYQALGDPEKRAKYHQIYEAYKNGGGRWEDLFSRAAGGRGGWATPGGGVTVEVGPEEFEQIFGRGGGFGGGGFSDFFEQLFGGLGGFRRAEGRAPERPRFESTLDIALEDAYRGARREVQLETGKRLAVEIPKGVRAGQVIRLPGAVDGQDLFLRVQIGPHPRFERVDDDLAVEVPITMSDAALGGETEVPTLDGSVKMTVPAGTQTGARFRLKGLGMPRSRGDGRGDLYARVRVVTPKGLSRRERELFEELRKARREQPRGPRTQAGAN